MGIASTAAISGMNAAALRLNASASSIASGSYPGAASANDMATDMLQFITARQDFSANLQVLRSENEMYAALIDVLA